MSVAEASVVKQVSKIANAQDIYEILKFVRDNRACASGDSWLELDFREIGSTRSQRNSTHWIEILSNELLGELASAKLVIRPPSTRRGRATLERAGLSFALAQRGQARTAIRGTGSYDETWPADDWRQTWTPDDSHFRRKLFQDVDEPDELVQHGFLTFLNPHRHTCSGRLGLELADYQAHPWVVKLLRRHASDGDRHGSESTNLIRNIDTITYELVENLHHAFPRQTREGRLAFGGTRKSYVQLYRTSGGGKSSYDRLHLVVADTGIGIIKSLRPKLEVTTSYRTWDANEVMLRLLSGSLPPYGRAAGRGYQEIVDIVGNFDGELYLTTGSTDTDGICQVYRAVLHSGERSLPERLVVQRDDNLRFIGTTAHAIIPLAD